MAPRLVGDWLPGCTSSGGGPERVRIRTRFGPAIPRGHCEFHARRTGMRLATFWYAPRPETGLPRTLASTEIEPMTSEHPNRRDFLQAGAAGVAAAALAGAADPVRTNSGGVPVRPLGRTGQTVSALCLGGHASTNPQKLTEPQSLKLIQRAVDEGITFMDNCWDYHDGLAEERMGKALAEGGRREKAFVMTKCCGRNTKDAQSNLEDSLRRLRTDHLDLWQFHEIVYDNDPDWIFADDGAIHVGLKAVKEGKIGRAHV